MHKAEISIFEKKYPILDFELILEKESDPTGLPTSNPYGGKMTITFASSRDDKDLLEAAMSSRMMVKGIVRMFRRDGIQKLFDYEFANAYILFFNETFDATNKNPVKTTIIIAPGILKRGDWFMENYWNPNNPFLSAATPISSSDDENEPQLLGYHIEDLEGNNIQENKIKKNQEIYLIINSENANGQVIEINLDNKSIDFEYNGKWMKDDIITDITLTSETTKVKLKAVKQK